MSTHEEELEVQEVETETNDDLDSWFDEVDEDDEDTEVQSAEEDSDEEEDSSSSDSDDEPDPDDEDLDDGASQEATEEGNSTTNRKDGADDQYSWIEALDPEVREEAERLIQSDRSNRGRVAAMQRRLDSVQAAQEAQQRTRPAQAANDLAAAQGKNLEDMDDDELSEFMEEFPSVAKYVQKIVDRRLQEEVTERIQPIQEERLKEELMRNRQAVRQEAERIFNTVETGIGLDDVTSSDAFRYWLSEQSPEYQEFARKAESVQSAVEVLEDFAAYTDRQVAALNSKRKGGSDDGETQETAASNKPKKSRSADQTAARRKQARKGPTPRSRSAELSKGAGDGSYDDWFDYFAEGGDA